MTSGTCKVLVLSDIDAVEKLRNVVGAPDPTIGKSKKHCIKTSFKILFSSSRCPWFYSRQIRILHYCKCYPCPVGRERRRTSLPITASITLNWTIFLLIYILIHSTFLVTLYCSLRMDVIKDKDRLYRLIVGQLQEGWKCQLGWTLVLLHRHIKRKFQIEFVWKLLGQKFSTHFTVRWLCSSVEKSHATSSTWAGHCSVR